MTTFIPLTNAWGCDLLTSENYQQLGFKTLGYSLQSLLLHPGYEILMQCESLKAYVGWEGSVVLFTTEEAIKLRSPLSGNIVQHTQEEVVQLVKHLKPDFQDQGDETKAAYPLTLAAQGQMVNSPLPISITDQCWKNNHAVIRQGSDYTYAYLHYLYETVPGLAQRLIAMHNLEQLVLQMPLSS